MQDFEKLGVFYLGREFDPATKQPTDDLVLYDSKDLVTHALCVGMTGSGKTGLGIALIEEAAIDGVPAIVIDPKGDLDQPAADVSRSARRRTSRRGSTKTRRGGPASRPTAFAADEAERWKKGLADWGQDGARIERLRDAAEFTIYTPGSTAGLPVSVLSSFAPPGRRTIRNCCASACRRRSRACWRWPASTPIRSRAASTSCCRRSCSDAWQAGESPTSRRSSSACSSRR